MQNQSADASKPNLSRRQFLKSTSAAVAGTSMLAGLPIERSAFAAGNDTLKIALVGCGGRGTGAAGQALSTSGSVKLVAMADAFKDRMDSSLENLTQKHREQIEVSPDHQFVGFDGYKKAIELADVVILATPPGFRPMQFEEAVKQGKHIFTEKPVATDAPGVRRFLAAVEESKKKNLKVGVGLQRHHRACYIDGVQRIHDGAIGDIVAARCYWNGQTPWLHTRADLEKQAGRKLTEMEYQMRNWYYFAWICGDHIVEQHIHNLDVVNWVKKGYPVKAHGMGGCQVRKGPDYGEIFDHHYVEFEYEDGTRCSSECRHIPHCWDSVSEHFVGTKGTAELRDPDRAIIRGAKAWHWKKPDHPKDAYQQEHDDLFDAIRNDKPYNEGENGAKSTMTAILGRMCTYSGQEIEWNQALNSNISLFPEKLAWDAEPKVLPGPDGLYPIARPGETQVV
jgi:predicted dehydrogenase